MRIIAYTLAGVTAVLSLHAAAQTTATAFEGARLIVGDGSTPIENGTIVVSGERITAVGRAGQVAIPAGATRISLAGKTIMPALIDTHVHLSAAPDAVEQNLRQRVSYGVTAAMSLGQDQPALVAAVRARSMPGAARYFTAGRGITAPEPGRSQAPYWITTADDGRKAIEELAAQRVDIVKIWVDDRNGQFKKLTPELYRPIIDEAHRNGLRVAAHIFTLDDAKGLLRAGLDAFAHGVRDRDVDDEFMTLVRQRPELVLGPNLPDRGVRTDISWLKASRPTDDFARLEAANTDRPEAQAAFGIQARNLAKMNAAGVRIVLGSDGNTPYAPHVEIADMVAAGLTPMQAIVAATRNGAEFLRLADAGTLAAGKSADFLVLDANPLDDITNTRRMSAIYFRGADVPPAGRQ